MHCIYNTLKTELFFGYLLFLSVASQARIETPERKCCGQLPDSCISMLPHMDLQYIFCQRGFFALPEESGTISEADAPEAGESNRQAHLDMVGVSSYPVAVFGGFSSVIINA